MSCLKLTFLLIGFICIVNKTLAKGTECPSRCFTEKLDNLCTEVKATQGGNCSQLSKQINELEKSLLAKLDKIYARVKEQSGLSKCKLKNIANNKPVTLSSWLGNTRSWNGNKCCAPEYATDGNTTTFIHTRAQEKPYLYVDLGSDYDIEGIEIINRSDGYAQIYARTRNLKIEVGKTLGSLKHCSDYQGPARNAEHIKLVCSERLSGRYVKVTQNNGNQPLNLSEVMVYAPSTA